MARLELKCPQCGDVLPKDVLIYQTGGRGFRSLQETLDEGGFRCEKHQCNLEVKIADVEKVRTIKEILNDEMTNIRAELAEILAEKGL